jgi:antitoxin component YwqK of YwqJK toxin-antitoxin module
MKNKILVGLFLLVGMLSYAQREELPPNGPRGVVNLRDELNRRQGLWSYYNIHGDLLTTIEYVNDKREGVTTEYYPGGGPEPEKIKEETSYFGGKKDGPHTKMYLEGQASVEGEYLMGRPNGKWTYYYEDGQTEMEGSFVDGLKDGEWKWYDRKGNVLKKVTYSKGVDSSAPAPTKDTTKGKAGAAAGAKKGTPPAPVKK